MTMKYTRLSHARSRSSVRRKPQLYRKYRQHGIALAIALILLGVLMVFTSLAATLMTSEARLSAAQYNNARTFNAGMASLELMTDKINTLFSANFNPTAAEIASQASLKPIFKDGATDLFKFEQKVTQLGGNRALVTVQDPPFEGLTAQERLFRLDSVTQDTRYNTQVRLIRDVANYQIPIFQFAVFGFDSLDVSPGPDLWLGGRTHTNRNLYLLRRTDNPTKRYANFYGKITAVGEVCTEILPSGQGRGPGVKQGVDGYHRVFNPVTLKLENIEPSVTTKTGPDNPSVPTVYDYNLADDLTSPDGGVKTSGAKPTNLVVTGIPRLLLPTESQGFQAIEILRRARPADNLPENEALRSTRFFNGIFARYSTVRILLDDDIAEFPDPINSEPRAYDLSQLADVTDPLAFWKALDNNVRTFDPTVGDDHPDTTPGTLTVGAGTPVASARVLPPQTNLINHQPEFQRTATGQVDVNRKRTYIKIELLINDQSPNPPLRIDITPHILNLGITAGPIPVISNGLTANDLQGNNSTISPNGRLRASTTFANAYPLNDTRLTNTSTENTIENMLPWLENSASTTVDNIGKFKGALGAFPNDKQIGLRDPASPTTPVNRVPTISYRFEPNAILRLQRTYFPYTPNNDVDMTTANVPSVSDGNPGVTPLSVDPGRIGTYPAKFKSLIAKPYFRFTDEFANNTYVKGRKLLNNGMLEMSNPFGVYTTASERRRIYNANGTVGNGTDTRFIRSIQVWSARSETTTTTPGKPLSTGTNSVTAASPNGILPADNSPALEPAATNVTGRAQTKLQDLFDNLSDLWSANLGDNDKLPLARREQFRREFAQALRTWVFKPGIPGFYALGWDTDAGATVIGDRLVDLDVNYQYRDNGTYPEIDSNFTSNASPKQGVIDLMEMTAFPNLDPATQQTKLAAFRRNVTSLVESDFPHLAWPNNAAQLNPNTNNLPSYLKTDPTANAYDPRQRFNDFKGRLENIEAGMVDPVVGEIPRENLVFDWNGDGLIEPPHQPFQGGTPATNSTILEKLGATSTAGAIGYSVESNICSLVPSSLAISPSPNNAPDRTTSVPVEIRIVEEDGNIDFPVGSPVGNAASIASQVSGLNTMNPNGIPFKGQAPPDPAGSGGNFTGANTIVISVPLGTLGITRTVQKPAPNSYTAKVLVRSAVRFVFQHPLAPRGLSATSYPSSVGFSTTQIGQQGNPTQIGRNLGLTDAHYSFPGHCYMDFVPTTANENVPEIGVGGATWLPRIRTIMDTAFPINIYDQREGRHISRNYGFQGIPTAADYYSVTIGSKAQQIGNGLWPDWPDAGTSATQLTDDQAILYAMGQKLPMPSPVALERRGMINIVELDMGNLKKLFRGDFDTYLQNFGNGFSKGQPRQSPAGDPQTIWGGNGVIDISDNGFLVYISDRRGDDNNDGIYEFNDVFGENGVLDPLDDTTNTVRDQNSAQKGKPGDDILRRDVDVETQPKSDVDDNAPPRTGEAPHGSVPVNDGFEYFCGNINISCQRVTVVDDINPQRDVYQTLLGGGTIQSGTMLGVIADPSSAPALTLTGAVNWRIVDSAKTGRIRAFRRGVRIVNGWDIPRWYLGQNGPIPRHFTGMSLVTENPVYIHGNLNAIGVSEQPSTVLDQDSGIPGNVGAPTASRNFLQTGNDNMPLVPSDFNSTPSPNGGANDALLHGPMSIMSDSVNIQSRAFSDARMFICSRGTNWRPQSVLQRLPIETTVKSAWLTGQPKAGVQSDSQNTIGTNADSVTLSSGDSPNTQGGVHNFPRFCEYWSDRFNYNGSFIYQFYSHQGNGPWLIGGPSGYDGSGGGGTGDSRTHTNYSAPPRNWNFDQAFRRLGGLPPGTPRVSFYKIRGFRQVFIEDQD